MPIFAAYAERTTGVVRAAFACFVDTRGDTGYSLREVFMKVAVTYENGRIFQHFGHTAQFKVYDIADGAVAFSAVIDTNGSGHGALAAFLKDKGVTSLICGGIGGGAKTALAEAGITLYCGANGAADDAVQALLSGNLEFNPDVVCAHHGHGDEHGNGHSCGSHGCGSHGASGANGSGGASGSGCGKHSCGGH